MDSYEWKEDRETLINPDEILVEDEEVYFIFNYPLSVDVRVKFTRKGGLRRKEIVKNIYEVYKYIYDEKTRQVGDPGTYERLYNRRKSNGPFGIWGHYIADLLLEGMIYFPEQKSG